MSNYFAKTVSDIQNTTLSNHFVLDTEPTISFNTWKLAILIIFIIIIILILILFYFRHKHMSSSYNKNSKNIYLSEKKYKIPIKHY